VLHQVDTHLQRDNVYTAIRVVAVNFCQLRRPVETTILAPKFARAAILAVDSSEVGFGRGVKLLTERSKEARRRGLARYGPRRQQSFRARCSLRGGHRTRKR